MSLLPYRTDPEHIEFIRKLVSRKKWYGLYFIFFAVLYFGIAFLVWNLAYRINTDIFPELDQAMSYGTQIGMMLGAFAGLMVMLAILSILWAINHFTGYRNEKLMLKYHDELMRIKAADKQP